ncbi:hypothetical protein ACEPAG_8672 [Sanghuangporus baumii]
MSNSTERNWLLETFHYEYNKNWPMLIGGALGVILNVIGFCMWRSKCYWPWLAPACLRPAILSEHPPWVSAVSSTTRSGEAALALTDIVCFNAQGGGAGLRATVDHQNTGRIIFLGGVTSSSIIYSLFVFLVVYSHHAFYLDSKYDKGTFPYSIYVALYLSSACIMCPRRYFQTGYRFIELIQGNDGKFVTEEKWLYMFDAIPMCIASLVYVVFLPGTLIQKAQDVVKYSAIVMVAPRSESRDQLYP